MLPLNFNHLYYFYIVAKHRNFSRASEELRVSQSAISVQIKQFEASLGRPLFTRVKTGVELTESGQVVFDYADALFHDVDRFRGALEAIDHQIRGHIRIGTVNSVGIYMLPQLLKEFHTQYPDVKLGVDFDLPRELSQRLARGRLDFAILPSKRRYPGLTAVHLTTNKLFLVAPADHPLAGKDPIEPVDLERHPFLGFEEGMEIRAMTDSLFRRMSISIEYAIESSNVATIKHMVLAGLGIAILPESAVGGELRRGNLVRLPMPSLYLIQDITMYYKTSRTMTPTQKAFVQVIRGQLEPKHHARH